jgi:4-hydroxybenzoate polyprenyltransferase
VSALHQGVGPAASRSHSALSPPRDAGWPRFLRWRQWGVLRLNPVFENTFVFFFVFLFERAPLSAVYIDLGLFLLLVLTMSSYGFLLNDAVDCERDVRHGDDNAFAGMSAARSALVVVLVLAGNIPLVFHFAGIPFFTLTWVLWCAVATAYSVPGLYLKGRGLIGLIAVALAMRTLPTLLILEAFDRTPDLGWLLVAAYVSLRGFTADLAHQLHDFDEDRADGIATFAIRYGFEPTFTLLDRVLRAERYALVVWCAWMMWQVAVAAQSAVIAAGNAAFLVTTVALVVYAERQVRLTRHLNPHQPVYPAKDVFYLLHKTFPKIVLSLYLAALLVLSDPYWAVIVVLLVLYTRVFSFSRLRAALRLKPRVRGDIAT